MKNFTKTANFILATAGLFFNLKKKKLADVFAHNRT